jgi:hypothetical protein
MCSISTPVSGVLSTNITYDSVQYRSCMMQDGTFVDSRVNSGGGRKTTSLLSFSNVQITNIGAHIYNRKNNFQWQSSK